MKRTTLLIFVIFLLFSVDALAQGQSLTEFNTERLQINKIGMMVLSGWAIGNFATNGFLLRDPASKEQAHFYRMNIFWNIVNLGLAIPGLRYSMITDPSTIDMANTVSEYHQMGKVLLMNAGLDVAYITGGFLMKEMAKSREKKRDILNGYGRSLILQGGFLLAFDIAMFAILQTKNADLQKIFETVQVGMGTVGLTLRF